MSLLQSLGSPSEDYDDDAQSTSAEEASKSSQHNATEQSSPVVEVEMTTPLHPPKVLGQKRRRVTRACDECRRKKIKCDGKQPCTHCTVYSYGQYSIDEHPEVRSAGHVFGSDQITDTPLSQTVPMINPQTGGVTRLPNTLKLWKADYTAQRSS